MKYPECRFGYTEARDKDGFVLFTKKTIITKEGKIKEIKEPIKIWGKILLPTLIFYCCKCGKATKEEIYHRWDDFEYWYDFFTSDKYNHIQFCLLNGRLYCENCFSVEGRAVDG